MKPERIQLGMKILSHWRQQDDEATFVCSPKFADQTAARTFLKKTLNMVQNLSIDFDVELHGTRLTLTVPATQGKFREGHLLLARGVASLASLPEKGVRPENTP